MGLSVSNHRVRTGLISVFTTIIGSCVVQYKLYTVDQENFTVKIISWSTNSDNLTREKLNYMANCFDSLAMVLLMAAA